MQTKKRKKLCNYHLSQIASISISMEWLPQSSPRQIQQRESCPSTVCTHTQRAAGEPEVSKQDSWLPCSYHLNGPFLNCTQVMDK